MKTLLNRLMVWQKLLIVGLLALGAVALPLSLYLYGAYKEYASAKLEAQGIGPALMVLKTLQDSQQHRGLSAQTVAGRETAEAQRAAMQQNVEQHIAKMESEFAPALAKAKIGKAWRTAVNAWKGLVPRVRDKSLTVEQSFQEHTSLSSLWLDVLEQVRDEYGISLDPEADGYFLHLAALIAAPNLTEVLGQARAKGTGLLAQQQATDSDRVALLALLVRVREHQAIATRSVEKAYAADPTLQGRVSARLNDFNSKVDQVVKLAEDGIVKANALTFSPPEYYAQFTSTINAAFDMTELLTAELGTTLHARIADHLRLAGFLLGMVLLLTIIAGSITYAITHNIATSARQLSETVGKFARGDDEARATLESEDELGQLSAAFNQMIDERVTSLQRENEQLNTSVIDLLQAVAKLAQRDLTQKIPVAEDITGPVADALNALTEETVEVLAEVTRISDHVATTSRSVKIQSDTVLGLAHTEGEQVATMAEQLTAATAAMDNIASLAQTCNMAADSAIAKTQNALETVTNTVDSINTIRDTIRETEKRIKRLGERSQEISGAVNLINSIAERTHILALNASMHAASAGEAGRGFAVVAEEVQRLAENARQATEQITHLVSNIQTETVDTVTTMNTVITQVVDGSRLAGQSGEQMRQTQQSTAELVASVRQIAAEAQQQAQVSKVLSNSACAIVESTLKTSEQLDAQSVQTTHLLEYASNLVRAVHVFKLPNQPAGQDGTGFVPEVAPGESSAGEALLHEEVVRV